jgi:hypothetical protein
MIQNVIREMGGIAAYGIISVCLFFTVFTGALLWALAQRKSVCEKMRRLPLEDGACEPKEIPHE